MDTEERDDISEVELREIIEGKFYLKQTTQQEVAEWSGLYWSLHSVHLTFSGSVADSDALENRSLQITTSSLQVHIQHAFIKMYI